MDEAISYYARFRGRVSGPFPLAELQRMVATGRLTRMHELSADNASWIRASHVEGVFAAPPPREEPPTQVATPETQDPTIAPSSRSHPPSDTRVEREWHYEVDGNAVGPISESRLRQMIRGHHIQGHARVWTEGMEDWAAVDKSEFRDDLEPPQAEDPSPRKKFRVVGTDRDTGEDVELRVDAISHAAAEEQAVRRGIVVTEIMTTGAVSISTMPPHVPSRSATAVKGFSLQRISIIIAASAGMIATFLPWVIMPVVGAIAGTAGDGWITFALFGIGLALSFSGKRDQPVVGGRRALVIAPSLLAGSVGIFAIVNYHLRMAETRADGNPLNELFAAATQIGAGLYLVVIAAFAVLILAYAIKR